MNYQAIQNANEQLISMAGVITEFKGEGINERSQKPYKKVVISDATGVRHNVTLRGTLPGPEMINRQAEFSIQTYSGTYQGKPYTGYSGFWNDKAPPQAPQQAPQQNAQQPPPQRPLPSINGNEDMRAVRSNALRAVLGMNPYPSEDMLQMYLEAAVAWILTGRFTLRSPTLAPEDEMPPNEIADEDIPY